MRVCTSLSLLVIRESLLPSTRYYLELMGCWIGSLKPVDVEFMRRLHSKVNLIPIIAKADTMTEDEVAAFKTRILADLVQHGIKIFQAPKYEGDDEEAIVEHEEIVVRPLPLSLSPLPH